MTSAVSISYAVNFYIPQVRTKEDLLLSLSRLNADAKQHCPFDHLETIFRNIRQNAHYQNIIVNTPCLNARSMGNGLTNYIEARLCANITNLHYIALEKDMYKDDTRLFFSPLPDIIFNPLASTSYSDAQQKCTCVDSRCHESENSLIHRYPQIARDILSPPVKRHAQRMVTRHTGLNVSTPWRASVSPPHANMSSLPPIPHVAIHYRCGDNDVGVYGLLAYHSILSRIPQSASTIYVMAEDEGRKTKIGQRAICKAVLNNLHSQLEYRFPLASVLTLRGENVYDDFTRLASAKISICSVSTFCFWAAISATSGTVYMPKSRLFAAGTTPNYGSNVVWMNYSTDYVVPGLSISRFGRMPKRVVDMLMGGVIHNQRIRK